MRFLLESLVAARPWGRVAPNAEVAGRNLPALLEQKMESRMCIYTCEEKTSNKINFKGMEKAFFIGFIGLRVVFSFFAVLLKGSRASRDGRRGIQSHCR